MARLPDLRRFATRHELKIVSVDQLIAYRMQNEKLVERVAETVLPTDVGELRAIAYTTLIDADEHVALVMGDITTRRAGARARAQPVRHRRRLRLPALRLRRAAPARPCR